jgi:hypothetical protein
MEQATPEFWAAESKKHNKQPLALICDCYDYSGMNKVEKGSCYKMVQHACCMCVLVGLLSCALK